MALSREQKVYEQLARIFSELMYDKYALEDMKVFLDKLITELCDLAYRNTKNE